MLGDEKPSWLEQVFSPNKDMARKGSRREAKQQNLADHQQHQTQVKIHRLDDNASLILVAGIFLLHSLGLASLFSPLTGLYNNQPIIEQDWGLHFHHLKSTEAFWHQDRTFWGYNPLFMAGYPSNTIQDLSIKFFEFAALGLATLGLTPVQWFKILAFLAIAVVPWLMFFAARNLFFDRDNVKNSAALVAAFLGTVYWWNSLPREMFFYGMVGYAPAAYASVLGVAFLYRIAKNPSLWSPAHLGWLILALVIPPLHVQSIVIFLPALAALLTVQRNVFHRNLLIWTVGAAALSILINLPWLVAAFDHRSDDVAATIVAQLPLFTSIDLFTFLKDYLGPTGYWTFRPSSLEKGCRLMLLLLGSWGTWKLLRSENQSAGIMLASAWIILFLVAYFGSLIPLVKSWQPLRFKVPLDLFLVLAASYLVALALARGAFASRFHILPAVVSCGLLAFALNLFATETRGTMLLRTPIRSELGSILEWIEKETPADARVLF